MTDNEIIKALKCCGNDDNNTCYSCPLYKAKYCVAVLQKEILDLINRQQAEIERLQKENNQFADIGKMYSEIKAEAIKEFAERLKKKKNAVCAGHGITTYAVDEYDIDCILKEMVGDTE